jgi:hypothetical protein
MCLVFGKLAKKIFQLIVAILVLEASKEEFWIHDGDVEDNGIVQDGAAVFWMNGEPWGNGVRVRVNSEIIRGHL